MLEAIGGTRSDVFKACIQGRELVAVKRMKRPFASWEECVAVPEVQSLRKLSHPNVLKLREVIREGEVLFLVTDYCDVALSDMLRGLERPLGEDQIRLVMYQLLNALRAVHNAGWVHGRVLPQHVRCCSGIERIRLCGFGEATETSTMPSQERVVEDASGCTAPEYLHEGQEGRQPQYLEPPSDMWAAGVLMSELYLLHSTTSHEQLKHMSSIIRPSSDHAASATVQSLGLLLPMASDKALNMLEGLLTLDPAKRLTADVAISHPFFTL